MVLGTASAEAGVTKLAEAEDEADDTTEEAVPLRQEVSLLPPTVI